MSSMAHSSHPLLNIVHFYPPLIANVPRLCRWVFLVGRSKECINRGGEILSPIEVHTSAHRSHGSLSATHHSRIIRVFDLLLTYYV